MLSRRRNDAYPFAQAAAPSVFVMLFRSKYKGGHKNNVTAFVNLFLIFPMST